MYFCWACDYSKTTGEGQLARLFVKDKFNNNAYIYSPNKLFNQNILVKMLNYKYFTPFMGVFICWFMYGISAMFDPIRKNISYNMLDIVAKNFYGLFIYYKILQLRV